MRRSVRSPVLTHAPSYWHRRLAEIRRIIMDELVYGGFAPESVVCYQNVFARMKEEGCDAVILGCTEIPLIMNDSNSPLPTLDSRGSNLCHDSPLSVELETTHCASPDLRNRPYRKAT